MEPAVGVSRSHRDAAPRLHLIQMTTVPHDGTPCRRAATSEFSDAQRGAQNRNAIEIIQQRLVAIGLEDVCRQELTAGSFATLFEFRQPAGGRRSWHGDSYRHEPGRDRIEQYIPLDRFAIPEGQPPDRRLNPVSRTRAACAPGGRVANRKCSLEIGAVDQSGI